MSVPGTRAERFILAAALVLLVTSTVPAPAAGDAPAVAEGSAADARQVLHMDSTTTNPDWPYEAFDTDKLNVFDFNGDGVLEIVSVNDNTHAYVFDSRNGRLLSELVTPHPDDWHIREVGGVAIGDVNNNGRANMVVTNSVGFVTLFEFNATASTPDSFKFDRLWTKRPDPRHTDPNYHEKHPSVDEVDVGFDGAAYLADANNDGLQEIYLVSDNVPGMWALDHHGNYIWGRSHGDANSNPVVTDMDCDGRLDAMFPTDQGVIFVLDAATGGFKWSFDARNSDADPGSVSMTPLVADINGDCTKEVVFGARQAVKEGGEGWQWRNHAHYFALGAHGGLLWTRQLPGGNPMFTMLPAVTDVNGDGGKDLILVDWNTIGHKPGHWERTGPPVMAALDGASGALHWSRETSGYYGNKDVSVADVDGDGEQEILANGEKYGEDGVMVHNLRGEPEGWIGFRGWMQSNDFIVADLWNTGTTQLVVPLMLESDHCENPKTVGCRKGAIKVFDLGAPHDAHWSGVTLYNNDLRRAYDDRPVPRGDLQVGAAFNWTTRVNATDTGAAGDGNGSANGTSPWGPGLELNVTNTTLRLDVSANKRITGVYAKTAGSDWFHVPWSHGATWQRNVTGLTGNLTEGQRVGVLVRADTGQFAWQWLTWDPPQAKQRNGTPPDDTGGGDDDGWLGVPAPGPWLALAAGAAAVALRRRTAPGGRR